MNIFNRFWRFKWINGQGENDEPLIGILLVNFHQFRKLRPTLRRRTSKKFDNYRPASEITDIKHSSVRCLQSKVCDSLSVKFRRFLGFKGSKNHQRQAQPTEANHSETK